MIFGEGMRVRRYLATAAVGAFLLATAGCSGPGRKPFPGPIEQRVTVVAERFQFVPSTIDLSQGKRAAIRIKSGDISYGIAVSGLGLRAYVPAKKDAILRFKPMKKGSFNLLCTAPAGAECRNMRGTIRVK